MSRKEAAVNRYQQFRERSQSIPYGYKSVAKGIAMGLGIYMLAPFAMAHQESLEDANRPVVACASALGDTALKTSVLPKECVDFKQGFNYTELTLTNHNAKTGETATDIHKVVYTLPPAAEFKKAQLMTEEDIRTGIADRNTIRNGISVVGGALWPLMNLSNDRRRYKEWRKNNEQAQEAAA